MVPYMQRQKSMGGKKKKWIEKSLRETKSHTEKEIFGNLAKKKKKKKKSMAKQRRKSWKIRPEESVSKQSHKQNNLKKSYKTTRDLKSHDDTKIKKVYKLGIESINHQESEKKLTFKYQKVIPITQVPTHNA